MKKIQKKFTELLGSNVRKKTIQIVFVTTILLVTFVTRFHDLGHSDYIGDEHKAFLELNQDQTVWEFIMSQRKGPMQFLVSHIPYIITQDFSNELAQRLPFSIINMLSMLTFFLLLKKLTKNIYVSFIASFLLTVNGFIVGFGRIAQYQNLNLLFSFLALYYYSDLLDKKTNKNLMKSTMVGTFFWCLSFLSHWDAIFIFPVVTAIFVGFLKDKKIAKELKTKLIVSNFALGGLLLLPFLVPFIGQQLGSPENVQYFGRRIELGHINYERYKLLIDLYNPFVTFYFLLILGVVGLFIYKKSFLFSVWFIFTYLTFELFVRKPGTHIYNFIIPLTVLCAISVCSLYKALPKYLDSLWAGIIALIMVFLFCQTYYIFIDHKKEYPWEQKVYYDFYDIEEKRYDKLKVKTRDRVYHQIITPKYTIDQKLPLFGFPHKRYWNRINEFINEQNQIRQDNITYISNEVKTITEWYMDTDYGSERPYYIIGIKKPLSFVQDYKYPQVSGKRTIYEIENEYGETVVRIYLVEER